MLHDDTAAGTCLPANRGLFSEFRDHFAKFDLILKSGDTAV